MKNRFKKNWSFPAALLIFLTPFFIAPFILEGFWARVERRKFSWKEFWRAVVVVIGFKLAFWFSISIFFMAIFLVLQLWAGCQS